MCGSIKVAEKFVRSFVIPTNLTQPVSVALISPIHNLKTAWRCNFVRRKGIEISQTIPSTIGAKRPDVVWKPMVASEPNPKQCLTIVPFTADELQRIVAEQID